MCTHTPTITATTTALTTYTLVVRPRRFARLLNCICLSLLRKHDLRATKAGRFRAIRPASGLPTDVVFKVTSRMVSVAIPEVPLSSSESVSALSNTTSPSFALTVSAVAEDAFMQVTKA